MIVSACGDQAGEASHPGRVRIRTPFEVEHDGSGNNLGLLSHDGSLPSIPDRCFDIRPSQRHCECHLRGMRAKGAHRSTYLIVNHGRQFQLTMPLAAALVVSICSSSTHSTSTSDSSSRHNSRRRQIEQGRPSLQSKTRCSASDKGPRRQPYLRSIPAVEHDRSEQNRQSLAFSAAPDLV